MAANGQHHGGRNILVLYRVTNSETDNADPLFNCFSMPYGNGPTLNSVKQHCAAAHSLSNMGPEGFHWRVLVEDKPGSSGEKSYSWWDIQDGNAKLPVKETTQYALRKLLFPSKASSSSTDYGTKAAKGAFKMMGKVASAVAGEDITGGGADSGPPVAVLTFKLLDLMKATDDVNSKHGGHPPPIQPRARPVAAPRPAARAPAPAPAPQARPQQAPSRAYQQQPPPRAPPQEANLMDFGGSSPAPAPVPNKKVLHHTMSSPPAMRAPAATGGRPDEDRWERLKREREQKEQTAAKNRVWDPIDQRWVEMEPGAAPPGHSKSGMDTGSPKVKVVGIKLDGSGPPPDSEAGRQGRADRIAKMAEEQQKKVDEFKQREAKKKADEEQEDTIRRQLDPKIKAWSEEHGKKKQLRALLASLHTVLWPGAKWKSLTIGDLLDDGKVRRAFLKASLVVHPDKTSDLPPDQRFLAKRIFDALSQAKSDFDNGTK